MIHLCVILSYLGGFSPFFSIIMIYPAIKYTHNIPVSYTHLRAHET